MRFYISLLILFALVLGFGFYTISTLSYSANDVTENFGTISNAINENNWGKAEKEFTQAKEKWNHHKKWWAMIIDHHEIDNIDSSLSRADEYLKHQDQALAAGELSVLQQYLEHIPETEKITWKNIF